MIVLDNVPVQVAIDRMVIWGRKLNPGECGRLASDIRAGNEITYAAYTRDGELFAVTTVRAEDNPVTLVTEINRAPDEPMPAE